LYPEHTVIFLPVFWRSYLTGYNMPGCQTESSYLGLRDINIFSTGQISLYPEKAITFRQNFQDSLGINSTAFIAAFFFFGRRSFPLCRSGFFFRFGGRRIGGLKLKYL